MHNSRLLKAVAKVMRLSTADSSRPVSELPITNPKVYPKIFDLTCGILKVQSSTLQLSIVAAEDQLAAYSY